MIKFHFFQKAILLRIFIEVESTSWFQDALPKLLVCLASKELETIYQDKEPLKVYDVTHEWNFDYFGAFGVSAYATVKMMGLNMMLPPVVVKESKELNGIGLPLHTLVDNFKYENVPHVIVFMGKTILSMI